MSRHLTIVFALVLLSCSPSFGQLTPILPAGFTATDVIPSGYTGASSMCVAPNGTIYIALKSGAVRVWREGSGLLPTQFFANQPLNVNTAGERGLIGIALDPNFELNRHIYVHYTVNSTPRQGRISRFTADSEGNLALPDSEVILLDLGNSTYTIHNGGGLHFGPDGMLYIGVGDNGVGSNAQSINNLMGKILRIRPIPGDVIPSDNPTTFPGVVGSPQGNNSAIWALGLRNPFTFAFQPGTGRMYINDVGSSAFEEINDAAPGRNFGWPTTEGMFDTSQFPAFTAPFHAYQHSSEPGEGLCIIGGVFCNSQTSIFPSSFAGDYLFCDFQQNSWIRRLDLETRYVSDFAWLFSPPVDLDFDAQGRLLLLTGGKLTRIEYTAPPLECRTPEVATLNPINSAPGMGFGAALALSGDTVVVGAPFVDTANGIETGAAFVFIRNGQNWIQQAMLTAPDGALGDRFGTSVAISGERVLIGSPWNDGGNIGDAGAAYVFVRTGAVWTLETKLIAPVPAVQDFLGYAVAMTSDMVMVGAIRRDFSSISDAGAAFVFSHNGSTWTYHSTLIPSDPSSSANFGASISVNANRSLIGASTGNANKGCAYIFDRVNGTWIQQARLAASDGVTGDYFGGGVSLSGDSALVGAASALPVGVLNAGAAYLFARTDDTWTQAHKFTGPNSNAYGAFGSGVTLSGNRAIIGAPYSSLDGELFQGTVYVYAQLSGEWMLEEILVPSDTTQNDCFGSNIAVDDTVVLIGQDLNNLATTEAGTVYAFVIPHAKGDLDLDGDVDLADASMIIDVLIGMDASPIHRSRADINCDGTPDGRDITFLVNVIIDTP